MSTSWWSYGVSNRATRRSNVATSCAALGCDGRFLLENTAEDPLLPRAVILASNPLWLGVLQKMLDRDNSTILSEANKDDLMLVKVLAADVNQRVEESLLCKR
jgi:hypothetical protein